MSFTIDNDVKDRVRRAVDIVDLMGGYLPLRRQGRGFVAQCPWHDDHRPSLQINPERQSWKCWVCDLGGDVFSFVMQWDKITFAEALRSLADKAGISIDSRPEADAQHRNNLDEKRSLLKAMAWACQQYQKCFAQTEEAAKARKYLEGRGINAESLQKFQVGYAPSGWSWLIERGVSQGIQPALLEAAGLAVRSERGSRYDRFRDRVLFPICDAEGRPIAIGGRVLPGSSDPAKYINCSETRLYQKSHQLYGLNLARDMIVKSRQAIVMEGYTDVIMAHQFGLKNAVACCGTAIGSSHIRLLKRYCDEVVLVLDGDEAGQKRTNQVLELFVAAQMNLRILTLPEELDPCDFLIERGLDAMQALIDTSVDALEHKLRVVCRGFDPLVDTHRANAAIESILSTLALAPNIGMLTGEARSLRQNQLLNRIARRFQVPEPELRMRLREMRNRSGQQAVRMLATGAPEAPLETKQYRLAELSAVDCELFEILIINSQLAPLVLERVAASQLTSETARALLEIYQELELAGQSLEFDSILAAVEEPSLKSVLVSLEELSHKKANLSKMNAEQRLQTLTERMGEQIQDSLNRQQIEILAERRLGEKEEIDLLEDMIRQARQKHGMQKPGPSEEAMEESSEEM